MSRWLLLTPFYALNPTQKAAVLAFVCNELLCNKDINAYVITVLCAKKLDRNEYDEMEMWAYVEMGEIQSSREWGWNQSG